jgi:hypothetical protein
MTPADTLGHQAKVAKRPVNRIACVPNPIGKSSSMACHDPLDHALLLVTPNASTPATIHGYGSAAEDKQNSPETGRSAGRPLRRILNPCKNDGVAPILDPEQGSSHTPP